MQTTPKLLALAAMTFTASDASARNAPISLPRTLPVIGACANLGAMIGYGFKLHVAKRYCRIAAWQW